MKRQTLIFWLLAALIVPPTGAAEQKVDPFAGERAQSKVRELDSLVQRIHAERRTYYEIEANWEKELDALQNERSALAKEIALLEKSLEREEQRKTELEAEIADKEQALQEAGRLRESLLPHLEQAAARLRRIVENSIPYHREERLNRLQRLEATLAKSEVSIAEKMRRTWEVLQIELGSAATTEIVQGTVRVGGERVLGQLLRVGRIGYFYRGLDGERWGYYDRAAGAWVEIADHETIRELGDIWAVAENRQPADILPMPISVGGEQ